VDLISASACYYCGEPATTIDHVVPVSQSREMTDQELVGWERLAVPACQRCNSSVGGSMFASLPERVAFVKDAIRVKYGTAMVAADHHKRLVAERGREEADRAMAAIDVLDAAELGYRAHAWHAYEPPPLASLPPDITIPELRAEADLRLRRSERANQRSAEAMRLRRQEKRAYGHMLTPLPGRRNPRTMTTAPPELEPHPDPPGRIEQAEARLEQADALYEQACAACPRPPTAEDIARLDGLLGERNRIDAELQALYGKAES
jgi:hypothetical protein